MGREGGRVLFLLCRGLLREGEGLGVDGGGVEDL